MKRGKSRTVWHFVADTHAPQTDTVREIVIAFEICRSGQAISVWYLPRSLDHTHEATAAVEQARVFELAIVMVFLSACATELVEMRRHGGTSTRA